MANIKTSAIITEIRGSIGGTVFQKSTSGIIARNKTTPVNTRTETQSIQRSILGRVQMGWRELPENKKQEWNKFVTYAKQTQKNNPNLPISGQQHYIKTNTILESIGVSRILTPQFTPYILQQQDIEVDSDGYLITVLSDNSINNSIAAMVVYLSMPVHHSLYNPGNRLRIMKPNQVFSAEIDVTESYAKHFGLIPPNNTYMFVKWNFIDKRNGLLGVWQQRKEYTS